MRRTVVDIGDVKRIAVGIGIVGKHVERDRIRNRRGVVEPACAVLEDRERVVMRVGRGRRERDELLPAAGRAHAELHMGELVERQVRAVVGGEHEAGVRDEVLALAGRAELHADIEFRLPLPFMLAPWPRSVTCSSADRAST